MKSKGLTIFPSTSEIFEVFEDRLYKPVVTLMDAERPLEAPVAPIGEKQNI